MLNFLSVLFFSCAHWQAANQASHSPPATLSVAQNPRPEVQEFPPSTALAEGVSPLALARLDELVQSFVDDDEIVGAELLVIKNGRSILHEAYGWRNREAELPMETGSVFCVRSMTKPLVGAAVLMLLDAKQIKLDDPISKYLPSFAVAGSSAITIEHLLSHTSGLPMSLILGQNLGELAGIQAVAELGAGHALDFRPGSALNYSDQGTDTLCAMIEVVSGMPPADFIRSRLLDPLGMQDSATLMSAEHALRARGACKYTGSRGAWNPFWDPSMAPIFPFFLGSQALYSTLEDYARFLDLWMHKGRAGKERLLAARQVRKALTPSPFPLGSPTGFPGLQADYGYLMQLWTAPGAADEKRELVAFGHTGSDGTHAWSFPEQDAMVLYFTQSRGNLTGIRVEEALGSLLLGAEFQPDELAPPLDEYLGYYHEGGNDLYRGIILDGGQLAMEVLGRGVAPLQYAGGERWKMLENPALVLEFERSPEGHVSGYHIGAHREFRVTDSEPFPSVEEIAARVAETHRLDLLEALGPLQLSASFTLPKLQISGTASSLFAWPDKFRVDTQAAGTSESLAFDGTQMWKSSSLKPRTQVEGDKLAVYLRDSPFARFGDWKRWHEEMHVIQRMTKEEREIFVLRAGDTSGPGVTLYVDWDNGRVMREDSMTILDGMGAIGQRITYDDFRDISGVLFPFKTRVQYANPLLGHAEFQVTEHAFKKDLDEGVFKLLD